MANRPPDLTQTVATSAAGASVPVSSQSAGMPDEGRFVPGTLLAGRYRIIGLLGRGGMGEVYRATDLTLGQSVALKFLPAFDERMLERFHNEVRVARQVSHPNVCRVYDIGQAEGMPFLSMEYIDGEDLSSLLHRIGRLPNDKAIELARRICAGLAAAHDKGVMHRDLKPQNIMLNKRGEVLIMDFGLAAAADQLHGAEAKSGTPAYMAPEQLKGSEVTHKSDLYALGLVLYELFTGKKPYEAKTIGELIALQEAMQVTSMTSVAADIDPDVEKVIRRCLDPNPAARPSSALAVAAALPGGDPLAAALAAGETPSPELVAASKSEGLRMRYSAPMLAFILLALLAFPWLKDVSEAVAMAPFDLPPDALQAKSREFAAAFGYPQKPADSWRDFGFRGGLVGYLRGLPGPGKKDWRSLFSKESPVVLYYRESPEVFDTTVDGYVNWQQPPFNQEGMVRVNIDSSGLVRYFEGVPPAFRERPDLNVPPPAVDAVALLRAAGLDATNFTEAAPQYTPPTAYDTHKALRGPHPSISGADLRVEYASWGGKLTFFQIVWPYTKPASAYRAEPENLLTQLSRATSLVLVAAGCFWVLVLARRNWRKGRADRRGALRLATFMFAMEALKWLASAHINPSMSTLWTFFYASGRWLFWAAAAWLLYLALEPALRARWPQAIITWNRVLNGKFLDEQVGSHILLGIFLGVTLGWIMFARSYWGASQISLSMTNLSPLLGLRPWVALLLSQVTSAVWFGLMLCFLLFGLRQIVRWDWLVALIAAVLMTLAFEQLGQSNAVAVDAAIKIGAYVLLAYSITRFGLVTAITVILSANILGGANLSADLTTWWAPYGLASAILAGGLAIFAFWRSLGDQEFASSGPS
jgi:serine/threonine-protein kinase